MPPCYFSRYARPAKWKSLKGSHGGSSLRDTHFRADVTMILLASRWVYLPYNIVRGNNIAREFGTAPA